MVQDNVITSLLANGKVDVVKALRGVRLNNILKRGITQFLFFFAELTHLLMKGGISMMNIKTEIFKLIYGDKTPKRKKIFVKEIDVLKIEPWISEGNFDIEHADALLEDIHEKQYMRDDILVKDVYKDINMLIEGAYVAGLNDSKDMSDEDINARTKELISKIELLR